MPTDQPSETIWWVVTRMRDTVGGKPQQRGAHQGSRGQIERCASLDDPDTVAFGLLQFRRQITEIDFIKPESRPRHHPLNGRAVDLQEYGAQHLMALDDFQPRMLEQIGGHSAFQAPAYRHVIGQIARIETIKQPEPLLGGRTGEIGLLVRRIDVGRGSSLGL